MALTDRFVPEVQVCDNAPNGGSCLLVGNLEGCAEEPVLYSVTLNGAVTALDESIDITIESATVDGAAFTPLPTSVTLRQGLVLWFDDTTKKPVTVAQETVVATGAVPVTVPINPADEAIADTSVALSWILFQIDGATNLPIDTDAVTVNNTRLKNGLQGSDSKTRVNLTSSVEIITSATDRGIWAVLLPGVNGSQNIYAVIAKTSGLTAFGQAQLASGSFTGDIEEIERATIQFNFQAPFALEYLANDAEIFSAEQLADLQLLIEYAGLAGFVA